MSGAGARRHFRGMGQRRACDTDVPCGAARLQHAARRVSYQAIRHCLGCAARRFIMTPAQNMSEEITIGPDGTGMTNVVGKARRVMQNVAIFPAGSVELTDATGDMGPYVQIRVSGAQPNTTVTVSWYAPPE